MSELFAPGEVARRAGGRSVLDPSAGIQAVCIDSRQVQPGSLFVPLPGTRTDGHEHLADALGRGAAAGDLGNDGKVGLVVNHSGGEPAVLLNETPGGHWMPSIAPGFPSCRKI